MKTEKYPIVITAYEYSLLNKNHIISAVCKKQLESGIRYEEDEEEFVELSLTLAELDELTGFVAAESNHARTAKQRDELGLICDDFEMRVFEIKSQ